MSPVTRSSAASARNRPQRKNGQNKPAGSTSARPPRSTGSRSLGTRSAGSGSGESRPSRPPTALVPSPRFSRARQLRLTFDEAPQLPARSTSGIFDASDESDSEQAHPTPSERRSRRLTRSMTLSLSDTQLQRMSRQEKFTRLLPNFAHDQRRSEAAAAAAKRLQSSARPPRRRTTLPRVLGTRRWLLRAAAGLRVPDAALREFEHAVERFSSLLTNRLRRQAGSRGIPSMQDVLAVLRRSGLPDSAAELRRLICRQLPMEQQQDLIRVAESGGRLYPASDPLSAAERPTGPT